MSICVKKSLLFPYLMIASTISSIGQPQLQSLVTQNSTSFSNDLNGHQKTVPSNKLDYSFQITTNPSNFINIDKTNDSNYNNSLIDISQWSKFSDSLLLTTNNTVYSHINRIHYQLNESLLDKHKIESESVKSYDYTLNSYLHSLLLLLVSLGMLGSIGFFIYYKNRQHIENRIRFFSSLFRFTKNSGFFPFWNNEIIIKKTFYSILLKQNNIFNFASKIENNFAKFHTASLLQFSHI